MTLVPHRPGDTPVHFAGDGRVVAIGGPPSEGTATRPMTFAGCHVVESDGALSVSLDIELNDELRTEGAARELVSRLQTMRRDLDFEVTDRIAVTWHASDPRIAAAFSHHADLIAGEVLATTITHDPGAEGDEVAVADAHVVLSVERAG